MRPRSFGLVGTLSALGVLVSGAFPLTAARASVMEALEMSDLVRESHEIVVGVTRSARSRYDGSRIVTECVVEVEERWRGGRSPELLVTTLGGAVNGVGMRVEGAARLPVGERAVLFLRHAGGGARLLPVGMSQGVLPVARDARGRDVVQPGAQGLALMRRVRGGGLMPAPAALTAPRPLDEVRAEVEALLAASGAP